MLRIFIFALLFNFLHSEKSFDNVEGNIIEDGRILDIKQNKAQASYLVDGKWYFGGERIRGDKLRSVQYDTYEFSDERDVYYELKYPRQDDFYITYVSVLADQSSNLGKAYVVDGGVGEIFSDLKG